MNVIFAKTALYAYPNIMAITEQIDELVEKKALCSMNDFSPALEQFNKIADLTEQKKVMFALKLHLDDVIAKLTKEEIDCLEYKYFKLSWPFFQESQLKLQWGCFMVRLVVCLHVY